MHLDFSLRFNTAIAELLRHFFATAAAAFAEVSLHNEECCRPMLAANIAHGTVNAPIREVWSLNLHAQRERCSLFEQLIHGAGNLLQGASREANRSNDEKGGNDDSGDDSVATEFGVDYRAVIAVRETLATAREAVNGYGFAEKVLAAVTALSALTEFLSHVKPNGASATSKPNLSEAAAAACDSNAQPTTTAFAQQRTSSFSKLKQLEMYRDRLAEALRQHEVDEEIERTIQTWVGINRKFRRGHPWAQSSRHEFLV